MELETMIDIGLGVEALCYTVKLMGEIIERDTIKKLGPTHKLVLSVYDLLPTPVDLLYAVGLGLAYHFKMKKELPEPVEKSDCCF